MTLTRLRRGALQGAASSADKLVSRAQSETNARTWSFDPISASTRTPKIARRLQRWSLDSPVIQRYRLGNILGIGACGTVHLAIDLATGKEWACKVVRGAAHRTIQLKEIELLKQIDHPSVVRYREHFTIGDSLHIIMELVRGKDLGSAIEERGSYAEEDARVVAVQLLEALEYLARKGIAHRDIKPRNILLTSDEEHTRIKVIDFGLGGQLTPAKRHFTSRSGTPTYVAPEVIATDGPAYGTQCDVWSAGVLLYKLLSGDNAFMAGDLRSLMNQIRCGEVCFTDPMWELVAHEARELVQGLLNRDPAKRLTPAMALTHKWLQDN
eukprot:jgi/Tetstr1/420898/TSEL_011961.t1